MSHTRGCFFFVSFLIIILILTCNSQVRHSLLDFSIRKRVKVSLFLAEKMQHHDGRFVLQPGGPLPNETNVTTPGTIRYADGTSESFTYPLAAVVGPKLQGDPYNAETRDCELGLNFYTVDRSVVLFSFFPPYLVGFF